jgi:preprotein translocase subunit SecG
MMTAILIIHVLVSALLIAVVLLQPGRGGGFISALGGEGSQSLFGVGTATFLTRLTTILGVIFLIITLFLTFFVARPAPAIIEETPPTTQEPG